MALSGEPHNFMSADVHRKCRCSKYRTPFSNSLHPHCCVLTIAVLTSSYQGREPTLRAPTVNSLSRTDTAETYT